MSRLRYLSVCSGIEAATVAWHPLGWTAAAYSEIEAFPSAVLAHHYPTVPNLGDMKRFKEWPDAAIDVLVGGTPCQSFSVAGLRKGLDDPRGNLMLTYGAIARRYRPKWLVWENVPGVLSSNGGRDFGAFLGLLGELGYGFAYRVLDAQYAGLAQRRKRVFIVGCAGSWQRAAAVLLERASLRGDPAPRREARESVAATLTRGAESSGRGGYAGRRREDDVNLVAHALRADGFDASEDGTGRGTPLVPQPYAVGNTLTARMAKGINTTLDEGQTPILAVAMEDPVPPLVARSSRGGAQTLSPGHNTDGHMVAVAFDARQSGVIQYGDMAGPLDTDGHTMAVAFAENQRGEITTSDTAASLKVGGGKPGQGYPAVAFDLRGREGGAQFEGPHDTANIRAASGGSSRSYVAAMQVRRLTPRECERLQGFPDDYTLIPVGKRGKPAKDGPRYKALGNSMAVPVMRWIGERIAMVEDLVRCEVAA